MYTNILMNLEKFHIIEGWPSNKHLQVIRVLQNPAEISAVVGCELLFMDKNPFAIFQFNEKEIFILLEYNSHWETAAGCKIKLHLQIFLH